MDYIHVSLSLLLQLLYFTAHGTDVAESDFSTFTMANEQQPYGPVSHTIRGPDAVTVGVPCSFVCLAQCSPECSYTVSIDDHSIEHKELVFTLKHWESSKTVTCTAKNSATGSSSIVRKTLYILEGPVNVSISGPHTLTPAETQRFLCTAHCRPFCTYFWVIDGDSIAGSGDEVVIRPPSEATSGTLLCKATNSVSGLFAIAILKLRVPSQSTDMAEKEILTTYQTTADQPYGPVNLTIYGPDAVTVGVPCSFVCLAQCSPECSYTISVDGQSGEGNELAFTLKQWESSKTVTCTAKNSVNRRSSSITKTLQILEGPVNVSISGPHTLTPAETQRFLCTAHCRPFCTYFWVVDGDSVAGSGDEVVIRPPSEVTSGTLLCKATNSVSGLFAIAILKLRVPSQSTDMAEKEILTTYQTTADQPYGPVNLTIYGPDAVTVGVPCSFVCLAQCSPECSYTISVDGQSGEGNELAFTLKQWESSKTVTCTAKNSVNRRSSSITKTLQILEGPVNVSISGPHTLTPAETQRFLCTAHCRPFCTYFWVVDGDSVAGSGDEVVIRPPSEVTSGTLLCKATNSVSGLFAIAILKLRVPSQSTDMAEKEILTTYQTTADQPYGPVSLTIYGPDAVTVGVPCSFVCLAQCSPECSYTISVDGQSGKGNELAFTLKQWESSKTVTCTAKNSVNRRSSSITKTLQILEGPVNVSISGPHNLTSDEPERFLCTATCRPSCNYTWIIDGEPVDGSGNEVVIRPSKEATSATLICKATNSVSGLFAAAVRMLGASSGLRNYGRSLSEDAELLPKLPFAFVSVLLAVIPP
ncbi:uncharacterized protein LOC119264445 [Pygocentrus nattereri]|uniref:uncharacterized protein LOC119264445 n=1 Tax=Pygocentrus nattereri TaxID=42514 RepID=UPI001890EB84|nr:uncharacterized protein LOC119264445 [Pygocentrus nattereri]